MATIVYGTKTFSKNLGYFGPRQQCPTCGRVYSKSLVRYRKWAHFEYIPVFPVKSTYFHMCPVCGSGYEVDKTAAKNMLASQPVTNQNIELFGRHILANKAKGLLATDTSYELWARDTFTGEQICIGSNLMKDQIKQQKKDRGLKDIPIMNV